MHLKYRVSATHPKRILLFLMVLMILLSGQGSASDAGAKISWAPKKLEMDVPISGTATRQVSFTPDRDAAYLHIETVPALAGLVTVEPAFIDAVRAGEAVQIEISAAFDETFTGSQRAGVIRVRAGNRTLANPLNIRLVAATMDSPSAVITGRVSHLGEGLEGVMIDLSGAEANTAVTDREGEFSFTGLHEGEYTAVPSKSGYWFEPPFSVVETSQENPAPHLLFEAFTTTVSIMADPMVIRQGESTTLSWQSINAHSCFIEPDIGEVALDGTIDVSPVESATYTISAAGPAGSVTDSVTVTVTPEDETLPVAITIITPENGAVLKQAVVMVRGFMENLGDADFGVSVNATALNEMIFDARMPAIVHGNVFAANSIPLIPGLNTITVTVMDSGMNPIGEAAVEVYSEPGDHTMQISSDRESGISPLKAVIDIAASFHVTDASIACSGPGAVNIIGLAPDRYEIQMSGAGIYQCSAEVMDPEGNLLVDAFAFALTGQEDLDALLRENWLGMKTALANSDIQGALFYFADDQKQLYSDIFTALHPKLPGIATAMNDIEMIDIKDNFAKYQIRKDENYGGEDITAIYHVYFIKTPEGFWKIYRY